MGKLTVTPETSATQRATWMLEAPEARYFAAVTLLHSKGKDEAGRCAWGWELSYASFSDGLGFHYTGTESPIWTHDKDPRKVLAILADFVSAWDEAQRYPDSENRDLFPVSCEPFLGAAEDFAADMMMDDEGDDA
jgi:hypothetical protein